MLFKTNVKIVLPYNLFSTAKGAFQSN